MRASPRSQVGPLARRLALALALASTGCSLLDDQPSQALEVRLPVVVKAIDLSNRPVPGVDITLGKRSFGITDAQGRASFSLTGQAGATASLVVKCPDGFASPEKPLDVVLTALSPGSPSPQFEARCTALMHSVVLGIRAENGPNLPVVYLGREIARTDSLGVAHAVVKVPPGDTVTLQLDTTDHPGLTPQNPNLVFKASGKDEMVLLEQKFSQLRKRVVSRPSNRPKPL